MPNRLTVLLADGLSKAFRKALSSLATNRQLVNLQLVVQDCALQLHR